MNNSIFDLIGNTPLVRLGKLNEGNGAQVLLKLLPQSLRTSLRVLHNKIKKR